MELHSKIPQTTSEYIIPTQSDHHEHQNFLTNNGYTKQAPRITQEIIADHPKNSTFYYPAKLATAPNELHSSYFSSNNYTNYEGRQARYSLRAAAIKLLIEAYNLADTKDDIMDYGCGTGILAKAFYDLGFTSIWCYD